MITKAYKFFCGCLVFCGVTATLTSCDDFFSQDSNDVLYADKEHLNNAVDTIYSVTGILTKLQTLADRTILFGEVRGDLVDLTSVASDDLRELATFSVSDDNKYNVPSDYYAVINNCNYFIAHADTALRNNSNQNIFMKEYAAVKAIRAWTYLQLVLNYGQVPFYTEPLLSKEEAEAAETANIADLQTICSYFINDLAPLPARYNTETPGYRTIRNVESKMLFFPLSVIRGDLYLWRASITGSKEDYRQAALNYYQYIAERNGTSTAYPTNLSYIRWDPRSTTWDAPTTRSWDISSEKFDETGELVTMIAGDSIPSEGHYSELCDLFSSCDRNQYKASITPSQRMIDISESQAYCHPSYDGSSVEYAPPGLPDHQSGDLRLWNVWEKSFERDRITGDRIETQDISKWGFSNTRQDIRRSRNVHIYRRMMVYLRMAEALNGAGYPRMAYQILSEGLSNREIQYSVIPYYMTGEDRSDSLFLARFDFPDSRYEVMTIGDWVATPSADCNMMGVHTRGSGWTPMNEYYQFPLRLIEENDSMTIYADYPLDYQQAYVDSLLLNEEALEFAFEGTRFYDIMRFALRQSNPGSFMAEHIYARRGEANRPEVQAEIRNSLTDQRNWYLRWKGKIGY